GAADIPTGAELLPVDAREVDDYRQIFAGGRVNILRPAERAARERVEPLEPLEIVRHDENDADVRDERYRADLVHKVAVDLGAVEADDAADRQGEEIRLAGVTALAVNGGGKGFLRPQLEK